MFVQGWRRVLVLSCIRWGHYGAKSRRLRKPHRTRLSGFSGIALPLRLAEVCVPIRVHCLFPHRE